VVDIIDSLVGLLKESPVYNHEQATDRSCLILVKCLQLNLTAQ